MWVVRFRSIDLAVHLETLALVKCFRLKSVGIKPHVMGVAPPGFSIGLFKKTCAPALLSQALRNGEAMDVEPAPPRLGDETTHQTSVFALEQRREIAVVERRDAATSEGPQDIKRGGLFEVAGCICGVERDLTHCMRAVTPSAESLGPIGTAHLYRS